MNNAFGQRSQKKSEETDALMILGSSDVRTTVAGLDPQLRLAAMLHARFWRGCADMP